MARKQEALSHISRIGAEERRARIDLAAAHRLAAALGWSQLIYNHFTHRVPDAPGHFLIKPNDLMFEEVTASSLIKLDLEGKPVDETENVNSAGFPIHGAVLAARPDIQAVVHIHTEAGMAMSAHPEGLKFMTQGAMRLYHLLAYHDYAGGPEMNDWESLQRDLGDKKAMILRHHGLLTCGGSMAEALSLMVYLHDACKAQLLLEGAVGPERVRMPSPEALARAVEHGDAYWRKSPAYEWPAMLRWADRLDPSYRD